MNLNHLNLCKKYTYIKSQTLAYPIVNLLAVDPYITEYIPIHFFTNYLYMIDKNFEEKGAILEHNKIYKAMSSNPYLVDSALRILAIKSNEFKLVGNGIIFEENKLKYCIMISSKYVNKIYNDFFEFLLTKSVAYKDLLKPLLEKEDYKYIDLINSLYVSLSNDFFKSIINEKEIIENTLIYRDLTFKDTSNYMSIMNQNFKNSNFIDEDEEIIKSLCFCKIEINPFEDIDGPEKELISIL